MKILHKSQSYVEIKRRWNTLRFWHSSEAAIADGFTGPFGLRYASGAGREAAYNLDFEQARQEAARWLTLGRDAAHIVWCEMAPHAEFGLINGELQRSERFLDLTYSPEPLPMRLALVKNARYVDGLTALITLRHYLEDDLEILFEILDQYPDCVVEFSTFSIRLGSNHQRTLIWEIRHY